MGSVDLFDEISESATARPKRPLWTIDVSEPGNEDSVLKWLVGELNYQQEQDRDRKEGVKRRYSLYKGIQYHSQETRTTARDKNDDKSKVVEKVVANHIYDLTQQKVSTLIKYKPDVAILPANDEFGDKVSAKMTKFWLDHIWYVNDFEAMKVPDWVRNSRVAGQDFLFITWDPDAGDIHPDYKKASKGGRKVPLLGDDGEQKKDESGKPMWIEKPVKTGEVKYELELDMNVVLQTKPGKYRWEDVDCLWRKEIIHIDEARQRYPDKASKFKSGSTVEVYNYDNGELETMQNMVELWHFYHKPIPYMEKGRYIVHSKDVICKNEEYPYSHGKLPCVRLIDRKRPGELHASSFIQNISALTGSYNNLGNMILKHAYLVGHAKWMLPSGAANKESLGNDITICTFKGPVAPQLVTPNPISPAIFEFRTSIKEEFQQISGVFGVSRGEPPPGIKAGVALQFLQEQENERSNEDVLNFNEAIRQGAMMTIAVASDYYDESDGRTIRVMGKNNKWMTMFFDIANLAKDYDVRIQNSSALPQSKAARTQTLLDLAERFPDQVTGEQVLDLLDMAQADKFVDVATRSIKSAEAENEMILDNQEVEEPQEYENHISHWKVHAMAVQEFAFKNQTPKEVQEKMKDHILATEMLMMKKALENPLFAQKLQTLEMFPLFFVPPQPEPPAPPAPEPTMNPTGQGQPVGEMPEMPVNPAMGGEPQQAVNLPPPTIDQQQQGIAPLEVPGPVEPTGSV